MVVLGFLLLTLISTNSFAQRTVLAFDGLNPAVKCCTNFAPYSAPFKFIIGEEVTTPLTPYQSQGVLFSVNTDPTGGPFAIAYGTTTCIVGGDGGFAGAGCSTCPDPVQTTCPYRQSPIVAHDCAVLGVNTFDPDVNCTRGGFGNNGILTAQFVAPFTSIPATASDVGVHVSDTEYNVHVRTLDYFGDVIHDCPNVFSGSCTPASSVTRSFTAVGVDILFSGPGIAKVEFIDENLAWTDPQGNPFADGFTIDDLAFEAITAGVPFDIRPQGCPNPLITKVRGVLPTAILGTASFDVTTVVVESVRLEGVAPSKSAVADVATPFTPFLGKSYKFDCTAAGADGFLDLELKFDNQQVIQAVEARLGRPLIDGEVLVLTVTGSLNDGTAMVGEDVIFVID
jgi:hypothetical protein